MAKKIPISNHKWIKIRHSYEHDGLSIRKTAKLYNVPESSIRYRIANDDKTWIKSAGIADVADYEKIIDDQAKRVLNNPVRKLLKEEAVANRAQIFAQELDASDFAAVAIARGQWIMENTTSGKDFKLVAEGMVKIAQLYQILPMFSSETAQETAQKDTAQDFEQIDAAEAENILVSLGYTVPTLN